MIAIGIIFFLAKLLLPRFSGYFQKSRQAEVALTLSQIYNACQEYYLLHGQYPQNFSQTDWVPRTLYYSYGFLNTNNNSESYIKGTCQTERDTIESKIPRESTLTGNSLLIYAGAKFHVQKSNSEKLDLWSMNERGEITHHE